MYYTTEPTVMYYTTQATTVDCSVLYCWITIAGCQPPGNFLGGLTPGCDILTPRSGPYHSTASWQPHMVVCVGAPPRQTDLLLALSPTPRLLLLVSLSLTLSLSSD